MRQLELLAPAKNAAFGMAAIDHGADAVYIGATHFGARAAAGNSVDDIRELCDYAHVYGAKVYVTVNTIVYDDELEATFRLLEELSRIKVDAVLVQDMAVADYIIHHPELGFDMHASTQTDNRSAEKVRWLMAQGFSRVVLARELSAEDIADIHSQVPSAELEVFVHGALCVSYSGLCYASQHCFGRSANRGTCAQFCRMKFDLLDAEQRVMQSQRHLLSLKDMNQSAHLEELVQAGATSFKIEGRLKDLAYVKNVTAAYSEILNGIVSKQPDLYCRSSKGRCAYTFQPDLSKSFNRGYTTYFLHGRQSDIASFDTPKAVGSYVGQVKEVRGHSFTVAGTSRFANGDGLCFLNERRELEGFRVNRVEGNRIYPTKMPALLRAGASLYRNKDQEFERLLSRKSAERKIPVSMDFSACADGYRLKMNEIEVFLREEHVPAQTPQRDNVVRQLTKLGGTPFECESFSIGEDFSYFIPSSRLAELRRQAVEFLSHSMAVERRHPVVSSGKKTTPPSYNPTYLYNIANQVARRFYTERGLEQPQPAYELKEPTGKSVIMQCRHCIKYALGFCVKRGGKRSPWKEPLSLRLGDGRQFRLEFDCQQCQMNVYA